ncbi:hypothetical protein [Roseburia faecis]|uniref:hypothetical protein n=1 Tax=Roseburia faecis TaxID=301302 RepID=UPI001899CD16
MMQNQHKLETVAAGASETSDKPEKDPQPQGTKFKVISPKDKISPQQVHENDLSPCIDSSPDAHKKAQPFVTKGLSP